MAKATLPSKALFTIKQALLAFVAAIVLVAMPVAGQSLPQDSCILEVDVKCSVTETLRCKDLKSITSLTFLWDGPDGVNVPTDTSPINNGEQVKFDTTGIKKEKEKKHSFEVTMSGSVSGQSVFDLCEKEMDGPEDCGKRQGDGKHNEITYTNDWLFEGMTGITKEGTERSLVCPLSGPDDVCFASFPGNYEVTYLYTVTNVGSSSIINLSVMDDQLGSIQAPFDLATGESLTLTKTVQVDQPVTSTVTAEGVIASGAKCTETDTITVTVEELI
jgi:hypothetical protein